MTLINWLSSLGGPTVNIEVDFDEEIERVLVDDETLNLMAGSLLLEGTLDAEGNRLEALSILDARKVEDAEGEVKFDVTDNNGGWTYWLELKDAIHWGPDAKAEFDVHQ